MTNTATRAHSPASQPSFSRIDTEAQEPYLWDIEHLSLSDSGFILWRGLEVARVKQSSQTEDRRFCHEIGGRCRFLESRGVLVTPATVDWFWSWFEGINPEHPYLPFLARTPSLWETSDRSMFMACVAGRPQKVFVCEPMGARTELFKVQHYDTHYQWASSRGFQPLDAGQPHGESCRTRPWHSIAVRLVEYEVPPKLLDL